jgi:hypothetical protein
MREMNNNKIREENSQDHKTHELTKEIWKFRCQNFNKQQLYIEVDIHVIYTNVFKGIRSRRRKTRGEKTVFMLWGKTKTVPGNEKKGQERKRHLRIHNESQKLISQANILNAKREGTKMWRGIFLGWDKSQKILIQSYIVGNVETLPVFSFCFIYSVHRYICFLCELLN